MQSVYQTFLTLGLGAAIVLGATESSSAQVRRPGRSGSSAPQPAYPLFPYAGSEPASVLPAVASPDLIALDIKPLDIEPFDIEPFDIDAVTLPPLSTAVSLDTKTVSASPTVSALPTVSASPIAYATPSVLGEVDNRQSVAQVPESVEEDGDRVPGSEAEVSEPTVDVDEETTSPTSDSADSPDSADSADSPDVLVEPSVEVEVEISPDTVEVEIELRDIELDAELNSALIDIPDYLLSPPNPLFVPINPETVEIMGTQPISLEQALEIGRRNSRELQDALQLLDQSQQALREARAAYLPTITATGQLEHRDRDISAESGIGSLAGQPTVDTTLNLDLTVNYDIFTSGFRSATVRAAQDSVQLQELQVEVVQEDLRLAITNAYYDLQGTDEQVRIAQDTLEQSRISLRDALAREQAGVGTRFDRLQAEVQLAEDEQDLVNSLRDQSVSRRAIADLLSLPPGIDLSASDPVEVAGGWALPLESTLLLAYRNRAELEQQLVQRDLNKEQERATLASRWPQLSAFASYNMNDLLDNTRVASDFEDLSVGLQLSWTLYNGGATRAAARQLEIDAERAETEFADTREAIRLQVEEEFLNLGAEFKNIQTAESAVGLAEEALRLARLRFGAGVGIQSDVLEAQTQLSEAEGNLVSAILGYNRALIGIQRAVSNWPDNNLSADPIREPLTIRD